MVEAQDTNAEVDQGETSAAADEQRAKKQKDPVRGFETIARQEIRRARRLVNDGQPTPEANFAVSVAGVLAMLDLAAAIREHRESNA
jgi:hypothetical protein